MSSHEAGEIHVEIRDNSLTSQPDSCVITEGGAVVFHGTDIKAAAAVALELRRLRAVIESQIEDARREWLDEGNADALARAEHWRTLLRPTEETA